ncbi:MAG: hypothetical protein MI754_13025 [Chromatiales bacterium]|nr:hypothetical protein [Chromatiales bacterium]
MAEKSNFLARLSNIKMGAPGSQLVFETDGFTLFGALAHAGVASLELEAVAASGAVEFSTAVGEVLTQLKAQTKKKLPKKAVLVTPSAIITLLELPVDPAKPRTKAQMSELVRWELEPLFAQQNEIWSIGALLMGRGYLSAEQRRAIVAEMELRAGPGSGRSTVRFGEVALDLGYINREQIDECLALQEKLVLFDDEVISGWAPQQVQSDEEREQFYWLAAGVGDGMRKQWVNAFRKHGIFLRWIYPQLGSAFGMLDSAGDRDHMLVDIRQEQFAVLRGRPGSLVALRIEACRDGQASPDDCSGLCHEQMRPDIETVHLAVADALYEQVSQGLSRRLERDVSQVPVPEKRAEPANAFPQSVLASLAGAAAHTLGHVHTHALPRVEAQPPKPPVWKRKELWPYAAAAVVLMGTVGFDLHIRYKVWQNEQRLAQLDAEYEEKLQVKKQAESTASEVKILETKLAEKQSQVERLHQTLYVLDEVILQRQDLVPGILRAISEAVGDEILLDIVEEAENQAGFHLVGWALTDTGGQLFLNRLNKTLSRWNYRVSDTQVRSGRGRLAAQGYNLEVWLTPVSSVEGEDG